ncbi:MAG: hypothetical protein EBR67_03615 [Proteobacteria bacterium]|nr:hypothetical protein [Pseudomonadota bacterium]
MGLLDDIKKLRERADTLNNSLKSPQGRIEDASTKLSRTQFENKFKDYKNKATVKNLQSNFFKKTLSESSSLKINKETELKENFYS